MYRNVYVESSRIFMKTSRNRFVQINNTLHEMSKIEYSESLYPNVKGSSLHYQHFMYGLSLNLNRIDPIITSISKVVDPSPKMREYISSRDQLNVKFADKDAESKPKTFNGYYIIKEREVEYNEELKELNSKFKDAIEDHDKKSSTIGQFMDDEFEFDYYTLDFNCIPHTLNGSQIFNLIPLFRQSESEIIEIIDKRSENKDSK